MAAADPGTPGRGGRPSLTRLSVGAPGKFDTDAIKALWQWRALEEAANEQSPGGKSCLMMGAGYDASRVGKPVCGW